MLQSGGIIFFVRRQVGGSPDLSVPQIELDPKDLDPKYDYDLRHQKDDGHSYVRGKFYYHRPYGWTRYGIKVLGRSEYEGNDWLGPDGIRTETDDKEWAVSYHGTEDRVVQKIIEPKGGLKPGSRNLYGKGVYSSPSIKIASDFATPFTHNGKRYKVLLQNRVNSKGYVVRKMYTHDHSCKDKDYPEENRLVIIEFIDRGADQYWITPHNNPRPNDGVYDIRPYGILIKEV